MGCDRLIGEPGSRPAAAIRMVTVQPPTGSMVNSVGKGGLQRIRPEIVVVHMEKPAATVSTIRQMLFPCQYGLSDGPAFSGPVSG
ncbi:hypothetical protein DSCO28_53750 [Desulfosarcina ovata subsp. sediminis]|uniref:Uncharacterized protein n=1 Tax=Desulfosarcina ovata subsp. sediminis TaxID=885957 RepID=A0A5K7ZX25_9BACT|nr:hypothetical protein DSCO28_53750 [Desulfosarcina ovata subsp. sediminis]